MSLGLFGEDVDPDIGVVDFCNETTFLMLGSRCLLSISALGALGISP